MDEPENEPSIEEETSSIDRFRKKIEARWDATVRDREWPCRAGCSHCCRALPELPEVTDLEWEPIRESVGRLDEESRKRIPREFLEATRSESGHYTCPLLDGEGRCSVYDVRPLACRTYGAYRSGDFGLWCSIVHEHVDSLDTTNIVWGNHDTIMEELRRLHGSPKSLRDYFLDGSF